MTKKKRDDKALEVLVSRITTFLLWLEQLDDYDSEILYFESLGKDAPMPRMQEVVYARNALSRQMTELAREIKNS